MRCDISPCISGDYMDRLDKISEDHFIGIVRLNGHESFNRLKQMYLAGHILECILQYNRDTNPCICGCENDGKDIKLEWKHISPKHNKIVVTYFKNLGNVSQTARELKISQNTVNRVLNTKGYEAFIERMRNKYMAIGNNKTLKTLQEILLTLEEIVDDRDEKTSDRITAIDRLVKYQNLSQEELRVKGEIISKIIHLKDLRKHGDENDNK